MTVALTDLTFRVTDTAEQRLRKLIDLQTHVATVSTPAALALAALTPAADKVPYFTSATAAALTDLPAFGRTLIANASAADARSDLAISAANTPFTPVGGIAATDVQAALAELDTEKLAASSYTAADVLAKLLTVDGSGSGIDADLLDGSSSAFFLARANHTGTQNAATISDFATAADARVAAAIGVSVQAYDADLTTLGAGGASARTFLGLGTGDSPQFTAIEIGHASDTTLARSGSGNLTIEGNLIYRASGTDVPVADGGTGASTAADARANLGLDTMATQNANAVAITGGTVLGLTSLAVGVASAATLADFFRSGGAYSSSAYNQPTVYVRGDNTDGEYSGIGFANTGQTREHFFGVVQTASGTGDFVWQGFNGSYSEFMRLTPGTGLDVVGLARCDSLRIDATPTAETPTPTHTFTISLNGTTYRVPCLV